mmetsp:Transcript_11988/g.27692  ORF Transcript_11988/g.27692 Transcript_11988/m.27692 type:complete len:88 (+) Transcript_11988:1232-1495(+)
MCYRLNADCAFEVYFESSSGSVIQFSSWALSQPSGPASTVIQDFPTCPASKPDPAAAYLTVISSPSLVAHVSSLRSSSNSPILFATP